MPREVETTLLVGGVLVAWAAMLCLGMYGAGLVRNTWLRRSGRALLLALLCGPGIAGAGHGCLPLPLIVIFFLPGQAASAGVQLVFFFLVGYVIATAVDHWFEQ